MSATQKSTPALKPGRSFSGVLTGFMIFDGCDAVVVLGSDRPNTEAFAGERANLGSHHSCLVERDRVDPNKKMMVERFVAAFAKAARVSDVPEEAITSDTREPSYSFWRLSGTGRR